jgi:hypothetical protein
MNNEVDLNKVYIPSEDVVARVIENEFIIVPLASGIGDMEDEIYALNQTGKYIWDALDGKKNLNDVVEKLCKEFNSIPENIKNEVSRFITELFKRRIVVEA